METHVMDKLDKLLVNHAMQALLSPQDHPTVNVIVSPPVFPAHPGDAPGVHPETFVMTQVGDDLDLATWEDAEWR